jgi:photosystem II stability/assembly factor-like uncharacterized protein
MSIDERDLRRALQARSGQPSAEYRARLSEGFSAGRPEAPGFQSVALVATFLIAAMLIGALVLARHTGQPGHYPVASGPRLSTPTPTPVATPLQPGAVAGVLNPPLAPIGYPTTLEMSAPAQDVLWALLFGPYLYRSLDHGQTWEQQPMPPGVPGASISFVSDKEGWLMVTSSPDSQCGSQGTGLWHTTDAGVTWFGSNRIPQAHCKGSISFADPLHGFVSAWDDNLAPVIYKTSDGGTTWAASRPLPDPPGWTTHGGATLAPGTVHAFGSELLVPAFGNHLGVEYVFKSTDGGATWSYLAKAPTAGETVAFVTPFRWLQVAGHGETTDSGASWHTYTSDYSQAAGVAPDSTFVDPAVGYAFLIERGEIQRTTDGGLHWTTIKSPVT